jgi:hypothetical protein
MQRRGFGLRPPRVEFHSCTCNPSLVVAQERDQRLDRGTAREILRTAWLDAADGLIPLADEVRRVGCTAPHLRPKLVFRISCRDPRATAPRGALVRLLPEATSCRGGELLTAMTCSRPLRRTCLW